MAVDKVWMRRRFKMTEEKWKEEYWKWFGGLSSENRELSYLLLQEAYFQGRRDEGKERQEEIERLKEALDHPPFQSYGDALREGCDSDGAWECFIEDYLRHVKATFEEAQ